MSDVIFSRCAIKAATRLSSLVQPLSFSVMLFFLQFQMKILLGLPTSFIRFFLENCLF